MCVPWVFGVIWGVLRLWCVLRWCRSLRFRLAESRLDKRLANGDLQGVRPEQVAAAHDVVDAHVKIVHDHHQLVGEQAVGAAHDGVADVVRQIEFLMTEHCIIELTVARGFVSAGMAMRSEWRSPLASRCRTVSGLLAISRRHVPGYTMKRSPSCGAEAARMSAREQKQG